MQSRERKCIPAIPPRSFLLPSKQTVSLRVAQDSIDMHTWHERLRLGYTIQDLTLAVRYYILGEAGWQAVQMSVA